MRTHKNKGSRPDESTISTETDLGAGNGDLGRVVFLQTNPRVPRDPLEPSPVGTRSDSLSGQEKCLRGPRMVGGLLEEAALTEKPRNEQDLPGRERVGAQGEQGRLAPGEGGPQDATSGCARAGWLLAHP